MLTLTHLEDMSSRLIRNLSKGYRQRVGLAQAILGFPKIIILDEPTVGLDPKQVVEIRDLIRHLAKEHTVIISSHILSEIRAVCDRVLIIRKGKFVVCDTPEDLEEKLSAGGSLELAAKAARRRRRRCWTGCRASPPTPCWGRRRTPPASPWPWTATCGRRCSTPSRRPKLPLLELRPRMASLEEVFLDLTDDDDAVAARAAALFHTQEREEASGDDRPSISGSCAPISTP